MPAFDGIGGRSVTPERATVKLTVDVPRPLRDAFAAAMRARGLKMAKAIRLLMEDVTGERHGTPPVSGSARKLNLRLRDAPRAALLEQAEARETSPAAWATALLESALMGDGRPMWGRREAEELRALYAELKVVQPAVSDLAARDALHRAMLRLLKTLKGVEAPGR